MKTRKNILTLAQYSFILLWGYAATIKLWNWDQSQREMHLQPFPGWMADILFALIPLLELGIVYLLINRKTVERGIQLSVLLLSAFTLYLVLAVGSAFGKIPCACGGILSNMGHLEHIAFNLLFIAVGIITLVLAHSSRLRDDVSRRTRRKEDDALI
ncbi:MauE/DoxX family redox-associated membrane protein [Sphingobacterium alkalisoli]|uniref:MauE/DoxX family redox-associated membrane protein n=1 Tax=Sphingobacterium alkalisoli TaxID=1874115 RepID=UPI00145D848A|nr:MauE/DoxX family redox-associated membrane protein [Sphingobacterium alkalisoli]